jgi:hypothetical protein
MQDIDMKDVFMYFVGQKDRISLTPLHTLRAILGVLRSFHG